MDLYDIKAVQENSEAELEAVAAKIKPLPKDVVPSGRFVLQLRMTLLGLDARRVRAA